MRSSQTADYSADYLLAMAPLSGDIAAEAARDEDSLTGAQGLLQQGIPIAVLPNPLAPPTLTPTPTPSPTPIPVTAPPPAPSPESTASVSPPLATATPESLTSPTPSPPTLTAEPPSPTPAIPTASPATTASPTSPPPTNAPTNQPTAEPTSGSTVEPTSEPTSTPVPVRVAFSANTSSVVENVGLATITVMLDAVPQSEVTVNYRSFDGTAMAPDDYTAVNNTLTFLPPQVSQTFTVPIVNDGIRESDEELHLTLDSPVGATLGAPYTATLTIQDNEVEPVVQFSAGSYSVAEDGGQVTMTVTVAPLSALTVTVPFSSTTGGTATAGADYRPVNGTLTLAPLEASQTFTVPIIDDLLDEIDQETVVLGLGTPTNALLGTPYTATLLIEDDDLPPTVQFSAGTYDVAEDGGQATITVELSASSEREISVDYLSDDGTARAGEDYEAVGSTLTFLPSQTSVTFTVTILNDSFAEANETVTLTLQAPVNAELGPTAQAALAITDNDQQPNPVCSGMYPPGEPNFGLPDGEYARVACDEGIIITLPTPVVVTGETTDTEYELIYYELRGIPQPVTGTIYLDLVRISIGNNPGSTDENDWHDVFYWGDGITDTNTSLVDYTGPPDVPPGCPSTYLDTGPGVDNSTVCAPPLVGPSGLETGIQIDVDNSPIESVTPGEYWYVRIFSPALGENDGPEVDSIEILP